MLEELLKSAPLITCRASGQRILTESNENASASKERLSSLTQRIVLSPEQFEALSKSMESDEPIKALMTKNLYLMIEAEFEVKIGAKQSEQTPERKLASDGTKVLPLRLSNQAI